MAAASLRGPAYLAKGRLHVTASEKMSGFTTEARAGRAEPDVSILVVSYNTRQMTLDCIASIFAETTQNSFEVIVVDNASSDGSAAALAALGDRITLIALEQNVGFARGNNIAAEKATGRLLLLLNPDTIVIDGGIDKLVAAARDVPEAGIWGGRTLAGDRRLDPRCAWAHMSVWSLFCRTAGLTELFPRSPFFNSEAYGGWDRDTRREVDVITGCFLLIGRALWLRLGGFDRQFFMYAEEADLCLRAQALGARPLFTPEAVIVHYGGASEATWDGKVQKLLTGKVTFMINHWSLLRTAAGKMLLAGWPLSRWLVLGAAGWLLRRPDLADRAEHWRSAWASRRLWLAGYERPEPVVMTAEPAHVAS